MRYLCPVPKVFLPVVIAVVISACSGSGSDSESEAPAHYFIAAADVSNAYEGDAVDEIAARVEIDGVASEFVTFGYRSLSGSGTATAGVDYQAVAGTAQINVGEASTEILIPVVGDTVFEKSEFFTLEFFDPSANATLLTSSVDIYLLNDDQRNLNDTGIDFCRSGTTVQGACDDAVAGTDLLPGQDAETGRDIGSAEATDGRLGFSLLKLAANGMPLADQSSAYGVNPWDCVLDQVTGQYWEVKREDGLLHHKTDVYSWYQPLSVINGGSEGSPGNNNVCYGYDGADSNAYCNTLAYVNRVNQAGLCGFNDWRLPAVAELRSLLDYGLESGGLRILSDYFPHAQSGEYWTATPVSGEPSLARVINFGSAQDAVSNKGQYRYVQLVRDGG